MESHKVECALGCLEIKKILDYIFIEDSLNVERVLDSLNLYEVHTLLWKHIHGAGPGREPINPTSMLKAQLLKHLLQIPSDRRLAIRLMRDRKLAKTYGFQRRRTPSARYNVSPLYQGNYWVE